MPKLRTVSARVIKAREPIGASAVAVALDASEASTPGEGFISPPTDLKGHKRLVDNSSILAQCICAYKNNIAGFGIGVRYREDADETPEMRAEWLKISQIVEGLNLDQDTKEVFADVVAARETYGIAYLEVIRDNAGDVVGIEFIKDTPSITKTPPLEPYVELDFTRQGKAMKRLKRFRKYRQRIAGATVYFKELGDPRSMDRNDGRYADDVPEERRANEILEFTIGPADYGEVRWLGQILGVDGSRKAESLNNRYFGEGRHTPLMILINGGTLTGDSYDKLRSYTEGIKGENGQHAFIVLEAENLDSRTDIEGEKPPEIQVVKLADILQKDELFQEYLNNNRRRVQSAFQLPDLYIGYTTDFNRATAQTAQEVTEKQVFQPERHNLAWIINNKLLAGYGFKHVEAYFKAPEISNLDDLVKVLDVAERAGGLTPNMAKEIAFEAFGKTAEDYEDSWAEVPLAVAKLGGGGGADAPADVGGVDGPVGKTADEPAKPTEPAEPDKPTEQAEPAEPAEPAPPVGVSAERDDAELVAVLKEVRSMLARESDGVDMRQADGKLKKARITDGKEMPAMP